MPIRERLKHVTLLVRAVRFVRARCDPFARSVTRLHESGTALFLQPSNRTQTDRWPIFFSFIQSALAAVEAPRLLSYGCATGEEVFSLRRYLPRAHVIGIDINPYNIAKAEATLAHQTDALVRFTCANSADAEPAASYDAIFCMAVLRHGALGEDRPASCDAAIRFADVETLVNSLVRVLKPGGYLVIWSSHFRFADMRAAADFDVVLRDATGAHFNTPLYGPDNVRLPDMPPYCDAIFRKR